CDAIDDSRVHVWLLLLLSLVPFMSALFFYCSRAHLVLHSFPTRRSSDLGRPVLPSLRIVSLLHNCGRCGLGGRECGGVHRIRDRSEEHTSELQSRFDIVCRLLLEKKKTT